MFINIAPLIHKNEVVKYQKFTADYIFDGYTTEQHKVVVTNEQGIIEAVIPTSEAGEDVLYTEGMLTPGFINCHCHLELSHLKGKIPEQTGLVDFILQILQNRNADKEAIEAAIVKADEEMYNNGIVAVGDISNTAFTLLQKTKSKIHYHNFIEISGFSPQIATQRFADGMEIYQSFKEYFPNQTSIVPHAPYSVSPELFQLIAQANLGNNISSIHNQETIAENELFMHGTGDFYRLYQTLQIPIASFFKPTNKTSLASIYPYMQQNKNILWVHNSFTSDIDIEIIQKNSQQQQHFWCICVNANKYIENIYPPISLLKTNQTHCVLGTDSLASNHQLNILDEIKTIKHQYPFMLDEELLIWATINGAKALKVEKQFGCFTKGKKPGVNCIQNLSTNGEINSQSQVNKIL